MMKKKIDWTHPQQDRKRSGQFQHKVTSSAQLDRTKIQITEQTNQDILIRTANAQSTHIQNMKTV